MQLKLFTIPILGIDNEEELVNKFLRSVKVLEIKREIVQVDSNAYWAMCVLYLPFGNAETIPGAPRGKIDYKDLLTEEQFKKFCLLRKIRKRLADDDAVPAFAVFTDQELSEISKLDNIKTSELKHITGIGAKKIEKYGERFCELVNQPIENEEER